VRALGLDLGSKRIGVAVSDRSGTVASPLTVLHRSRSRRHDHAAIAALVADEEAERVVVGLPLSLSGELGPAARAALAEAEQLATVVSVPVETHDERLTTVSAERSLMEARMRAEARRRVVDKVAAAVMLQSWLDTRRARAEREAGTS
jgi:putative Holliday junction resolvase